MSVESISLPIFLSYVAGLRLKIITRGLKLDD